MGRAAIESGVSLGGAVRIVCVTAVGKCSLQDALLLICAWLSVHIWEVVLLRDGVGSLYLFPVERFI